jgi:hypothetical protein
MLFPLVRYVFWASLTHRYMCNVFTRPSFSSVGMVFHFSSTFSYIVLVKVRSRKHKVSLKVFD